MVSKEEIPSPCSKIMLGFTLDPLTYFTNIEKNLLGRKNKVWKPLLAVPSPQKLVNH